MPAPEQQANADAMGCYLADSVMEVFAATEALVMDASEKLNNVAVSTILEDIEFACAGDYAYSLRSHSGVAISADGASPANLPITHVLRQDSGEINSSMVLLVNVGSGSRGEGAARRLQARAAAKSSSGTGGSRAAVRTSTIEGLGWTVDDWDVAGVRKEGAVVVPRSVGLGNVLLGGLFLHQVRVHPLLPRILLLNCLFSHASFCQSNEMT